MSSLAHVLTTIPNLLSPFILESGIGMIQLIVLRIAFWIGGLLFVVSVCTNKLSMLISMQKPGSLRNLASNFEHLERRTRPEGKWVKNQTGGSESGLMPVGGGDGGMGMGGETGPTGTTGGEESPGFGNVSGTGGSDTGTTTTNTTPTPTNPDTDTTTSSSSPSSPPSSSPSDEEETGSVPFDDDTTQTSSPSATPGEDEPLPPVTPQDVQEGNLSPEQFYTNYDQYDPSKDRGERWGDATPKLDEENVRTLTEQAVFDGESIPEEDYSALPSESSFRDDISEKFPDTKQKDNTQLHAASIKLIQNKNPGAYSRINKSSGQGLTFDGEFVSASGSSPTNTTSTPTPDTPVEVTDIDDLQYSEAGGVYTAENEILSNTPLVIGQDDISETTFKINQNNEDITVTSETYIAPDGYDDTIGAMTVIDDTTDKRFTRTAEDGTEYVSLGDESDSMTIVNAQPELNDNSQRLEARITDDTTVVSHDESVNAEFRYGDEADVDIEDINGEVVETTSASASSNTTETFDSLSTEQQEQIGSLRENIETTREECTHELSSFFQDSATATLSLAEQTPEIQDELRENGIDPEKFATELANASEELSNSIDKASNTKRMVDHACALNQPEEEGKTWDSAHDSLEDSGYTHAEWGNGMDTDDVIEFTNKSGEQRQQLLNENKEKIDDELYDMGLGTESTPVRKTREEFEKRKKEVGEMTKEEKLATEIAQRNLQKSMSDSLTHEEISRAYKTPVF